MKQQRWSVAREVLVTGSTLLVGASGVIGLALLPASAAAAATGSCISLGSAGAYSEYSTSTAEVTGDTTDDGVAYGGQAGLNRDSFANEVTPASQVTLVAGGVVSNATSVTLVHGSAEYVGPLTGSITDAGGGTVTQVAASGLPFQFATAGSTLSAASATLASFATDGTIMKTGATLTLTGTGTGAETNVFDVNASGGEVSGVTTVAIDAPAGGVAVVNLAASTISLTHVTVTLTGGITANDVLFNLPTATAVTLGHDTILGTVLAPIASVTATHLTVTEGSILVDVANFTNDDITGPLFAGCVPSGGPGTSTPESPSVLLLPVAGVVAGGGYFAWRRRLGASAA